MLVARKNQLFNVHWKERLNVSITDTGNALNDDEIIDLSHSLNIKELLCYWNEVAGILLMPPTRHIMLHLNYCCKWKEHIRSNKKIYRS
ncbi:hypothetical protein [Clostridium oryzae]|uniref:Uncharacterized protein n=1 Tax=Clostridium oryzae TaxID=1450648 RepID=A0A1V4IV95_9CLOT|nr:hypothetical protein [Clostridium oryzae]OPJ63829.1 hypothetical protein CLORY_10130 [Clostridium oryzae]